MIKANTTIIALHIAGVEYNITSTELLIKAEAESLHCSAERIKGGSLNDVELAVASAVKLARLKEKAESLREQLAQLKTISQEFA